MCDFKQILEAISIVLIETKGCLLMNKTLFRMYKFLQSLGTESMKFFKTFDCYDLRIYILNSYLIFIIV